MSETKKISKAINIFAKEMKKRMLSKLHKGYSGWDDIEKIVKQRKNIVNHEEVDLANRAMILYFLKTKIYEQ